jgi:ribosomal protein S18 acetylase RimI-like enzyme
MRRFLGAEIEPLGADLVALAQAYALDATMFPHPSLPIVLGVPGATPQGWVARVQHGGPVVGFVATRSNGVVLEISGLAVDVEHQRYGLGRALLRTAVRSAGGQGLARVVLHVSIDNAAALALYESEGFRKEQRQPHYYPSDSPQGGAAWLMIRPS